VAQDRVIVNGVTVYYLPLTLLRHLVGPKTAEQAERSAYVGNLLQAKESRRPRSWQFTDLGSCYSTASTAPATPHQLGVSLLGGVETACTGTPPRVCCPPSYVRGARRGGRRLHPRHRGAEVGLREGAQEAGRRRGGGAYMVGRGALERRPEYAAHLATVRSPPLRFCRDTSRLPG
jgi:hypothetical protein